jgi:protein SCO1
MRLTALAPNTLSRRKAMGSLLALATGSLIAAEPAAAATSFYANFQGLKLKDQEGWPLDTAKLRGRLVLVNFVYTGCSTVCPMQTRSLADMQRQLPPALRQRVHLLSVSLDPLQDTPQALKDFARRMGADLNGWTFATGRPRDTDRLATALRLYKPDPAVRKPDDHNTALWLIDAKGSVRMRYAGNPPDVPRLLRELAALDQLEKATKA